MGQMKWADEVEDDVPFPTRGQQQAQPARFVSGPDKDGISTIVEYIQKDGLSYKVQKKVRTVEIHVRVNKAAQARENLAKFGKEKDVNSAAGGQNQVAKEDAETEIELNPALKHKNIGDEEKFWEESISISDALLAVATKKKWDASAIRLGKIEEEAAAVPAADTQTDQQAAQQMIGDAEKKGAYVPPSLRNKARVDQDKAEEQTTLRVTNLSEDVRDGDLQQLFAPFGRLQRVFLARHREGEKEGQSKGFAFVTYAERKDAEAAMKKLNGHGYDNLILQVYWAQPRP